MSDSPLVEYTEMSPNNSGVRTQKISRITPHCYCGQVTAERMGHGFAKPATKASSNYGIGVDGKIGLFVPENKRSWCSSSEANDQRAITIECASDAEEPCEFNKTVYNRLIDLCVDICKRNGKTHVIWIPDREKALAYSPKDNEILLTVHRWFTSSRSCPGTWMINRMAEFACAVNDRLNNDVLYRVQVGSFHNKAYAEAYCEKIKKDGYPAFVVRVAK